MAVRSNITFPAADGTKLKGWFYSAGAAKPCIIMSNGLSGSKEHFLDDFAARFQAAGYASLVYDNRNWGESEGEPRNHTDPQLQTRDYLSAYNFVISLPDVDANTIVYWGSSLAGGNAICAAAIDRRIRGVIAQVPFVSGAMVSDTLGPKATEILDIFGRRDLSAMIPVIPDSIEEVESGASQAILKSLDVFPFLAELDRRGVSYENSVTVESLVYMQSHEPRACIHRIAPTPLLMVIGERDECIPSSVQLAAYGEALEPKKLHILRGKGHFDPYYGPTFEDNIQVQLGFLKSIL